MERASKTGDGADAGRRARREPRALCASACLLGALAIAGCGGSDPIGFFVAVHATADAEAPVLEAATVDASPTADAEGALPPLRRSSPPMGWNTWNHFHCSIDEDLIRGSADALVTSGLREAGYGYVVLDDCWASTERAPSGAIKADPASFPSGIAALADYVHARGLKLGLYTAAGDRTCKSRTGSYGHEEQDVRTFAAWGVDFVKEDWCSAAGQKLDAPTQYALFADAIRGSGRDMVFSVCTAGRDWPIQWAPPIAAMWRTTGDLDLRPSFEGMLETFHDSSWAAAVASYGHANDPDILEVGNGTMTPIEEKAHFSLWAISAAPLMLGNDLRAMSPSTALLVGNPEVIAIDQDKAGVQASLAGYADGVEVWARPLEEPGARAVVVLNTAGTQVKGQLQWPSIGLQDGKASVRDVWARGDLGSLSSYSFDLAPHDVAMLVVRGHDASVAAGGLWSLGALPWTYATTGQGAIRRDRASEGATMRIGGVSYDKGLGVYAESVVTFDLAGRCNSFSATVGVDDAFQDLFVPRGNGGTVTFEVWTDETKRLDTGLVTRGAPGRRMDVDVGGARTLRLVVTGAGDSTTGDTADWADAVLDCR